MCVRLCIGVHTVSKCMSIYVVGYLLVSLLVLTAIFRHPKLSAVMNHDGGTRGLISTEDAYLGGRKDVVSVHST